jgi:hypothetical protein
MYTRLSLVQPTLESDVLTDLIIKLERQFSIWVETREDLDHHNGLYWSRHSSLQEVLQFIISQLL